MIMQHTDLVGLQFYANRNQYPNCSLTYKNKKLHYAEGPTSCSVSAEFVKCCTNNANRSCVSLRTIFLLQSLFITHATLC